MTTKERTEEVDDVEDEDSKSKKRKKRKTALVLRVHGPSDDRKSMDFILL